MCPPQPAEGSGAVVYVWISDEPGLAAEGQAERARAHCQRQGWTVAAEIEARRFPALTRLTQALTANGATYIVVAREALDSLDRHFPEAWRGARTRIEAGGATIIVI